MKKKIDQLRNIELSAFHTWSFGVVAEDNKTNEKIIKVFPIERMYTETGIIDDEDIESEVTSIFAEDDPENNRAKYSSKTETITFKKSNYIYATWLQANNGNRITPPNVYKKEKVRIYRFSNKNEYYWDTIDTDLLLRRDEHVVFEYRTNKKNREELDDSYHFTISPKNKKVHLHISNSNGELTTYDLSIDSEKGLLKVIDGKGNFIELDSDKDTLSAEINKIINIKTETINFKVKDFNIETERFDMKSSESTSIDSGNTSIKSDKVTTLESGSETKLKASKLDIDTGKIIHDGTTIDNTHTHISAKPGDPTSPPV